MDVGMKANNKLKLTGFMFIFPSLVFFLVFFFYPLLLCFVNSVSKTNLLLGTREFVGAKNFVNLFQRDAFKSSVIITLRFVAMSLPVIMVFDLFFANAISRLNGRANRFFTTVSFLPFMVSMVCAGIVWDWLLDPNLGLVNSFLHFIGVGGKPLWLRGPKSALPSTLFITIWVRAPFGIMILLGGMQNVPKELYEVADLDGVGPFRRFFSITLPLINSQLLLVFTLETIFAFRAFDQIYTSTGGGPGGATRTLMIYLIKDLFVNNYGIASALTVLMLLVMFIVSFIQQMTVRRKVEY